MGDRKKETRKVMVRFFVVLAIGIVVAICLDNVLEQKRKERYSEPNYREKFRQELEESDTIPKAGVARYL